MLLIIVDDDGRGEGRIDTESRAIGQFVTLLDQPPRVDVGDRRGAARYRISVAGGQIVACAGHEVGSYEHDEERDRQSDDDRLQNEDQS